MATAQADVAEVARAHHGGGDPMLFEQLQTLMRLASEKTALGERFEHGDGVPRDLEQAHQLYCEAAREGFADAQLRLGWMYANGRGVPLDSSIANTFFRLAAEQGLEVAGRLATAIKADAPAVLPRCMQPARIENLAEQQAGAPAATPRRRGYTPSTHGLAFSSTAVVIPTSGMNTDQRRIVQIIEKMAPQFGLDPRFVAAVVQTESNFNPNARSGKDAHGLMQLIPATAARFGVRDILDPIQNLRGGMSYLRWLLAYFRGDAVLAAAAYNAGEGAVDRYRGIPPYAETVAYVRRIRSLYPTVFHPFDASAANPSAALSSLQALSPRSGPTR